MNFDDENEPTVHHERGFNWAAGHDRVHDLLLPARGRDFAVEAELVTLEVQVRSRGLAPLVVD